MTTDWLFWLGGGLLGLVGLWLCYWALVADRAKGRKRCPKCWYNMQAAENLRCPECGKTVKNERKLLKTRRRWRWAAFSVLVILGSIALDVTPKVRDDGFASILPTTALILIQRYRNDYWAYNGLASRMALKQPDSSGKYPPSKLYAWQWRMLATTCLQNIQDAENVFFEERAFQFLSIAAQSGVEPPINAGVILAEYIENPPARGMWFIRLMSDDSRIGSWLADQSDVIDEAARARLSQTSSADEVRRLMMLLASRKDEDHLVRELLRIIPKMKDASCVEEVFEPIVSYLFRSAWDGRKAEEKIIKSLIEILSSNLKYSRHSASILLAAPEVVDPQLALRLLQDRVDSADSEIDLRMVRITFSLIKKFEEEGLTDESDYENTALFVRTANSISSVDFDLFMFVIRRDLDGNPPYQDGLLIDTLIIEEELTELALRVLKQLALDEQPEIRQMVPSRAGRLSSREEEAMSILMSLRDDTSELVQKEVDRALESIDNAGNDSP